MTSEDFLTGYGWILKPLEAVLEFLGSDTGFFNLPLPWGIFLLFCALVYVQGCVWWLTYGWTAYGHRMWRWSFWWSFVERHKDRSWAAEFSFIIFFSFLWPIPLGITLISLLTIDLWVIVFWWSLTKRPIRTAVEPDYPFAVALRSPRTTD